MNKRGFLRVIEASVAVVIIMGVLFIFYDQKNKDADIDYSENARDILEELSRNVSMRQEILDENEIALENFVSSRIPVYLSYEARICNINDVCGKSSYTFSDIFVGERIISATLTSNDSKKAKLFIWEEK